MANSGLADGVYIEGLDGKTYAVDDWQGGNDANSVIVVSGDVKFRVALSQPSSRMKMSFNYTDPLENYITAITDETEAKADYDGVGNTAKILQMQPSRSYVAGYCNAFTFPDGKTKGYLPSLGQLYVAYQNKDAITAALSACGGTAMNSAGYEYWSSTFWGIDGDDYRNCWSLIWSDGSIRRSALYDNSYVRPFADLS